MFTFTANSGDLELDLFLFNSMSRKDPICIQPRTHQSIVLPESTESVDEMSAEVGVDVLGGELGIALSVDRPVCVVTHNLSIFNEFTPTLRFSSTAP